MGVSNGDVIIQLRGVGLLLIMRATARFKFQLQKCRSQTSVLNCPDWRCRGTRPLSHNIWTPPNFHSPWNELMIHIYVKLTIPLEILVPSFFRRKTVPGTVITNKIERSTCILSPLTTRFLMTSMPTCRILCNFMVLHEQVNKNNVYREYAGKGYVFAQPLQKKIIHFTQ